MELTKREAMVMGTVMDMDMDMCTVTEMKKRKDRGTKKYLVKKIFLPKEFQTEVVLSLVDLLEMKQNYPANFSKSDA